MNNLRTYEISIWTIQDEFISVLESAFLKDRGKTQNAQMNLDVDGTQELSFSIPKILREKGEKRINPAWEIIHEENLIINTRKIKIIFNKNTADQEIYEFVIDKVTESHNNDELICEVSCTGLAFFELGKIGYKISMSKEDFYEDDLKWFNQEKDENGKLYFKKQPIANIQYWLNKFLDKIPDEENIYDDRALKRSKWYYTIQMNWDHYYNNYRSKRSPHKIYEDDGRFFYIDMAQVSTTSVNKSMIEDEDARYKEKARMVDLSESNIYNLTQDIAEIFGVYCKYLYLHDENFYITGRIIIFYNSFLYDDNNLNITYRYQSDSIQRDIDSTDIVTKMYVKTVEDYISIIDVESNTSGEDYLLNFDYLHEIGTISNENYDYVKIYEKKMKNLNTQLKPLSLRITDLETNIIDVKAKITLLKDSTKLSEETVTRNNELAKRFSDVSHKTSTNPDQKVLLLDSESDNELYYIDVSNIKGLKEETLKIYKKLNVMGDNPETRLSEEITGYKVEYDDFNNNTRIINIPLEDNESYIVYLTYSWEPSVYYYNIAAVWQQRLNKDNKELAAQEKRLASLEQSLELVKNKQKELIEEKEEEIKYFEELMGPALREGYWLPANYSDYGDTYVSNYLINDETKILTGSSSYDYFIWDENLFPEEQDIKYELGVTQDITYYPCIDLSSVWNRIKDNLNELSFLYYDFEETEFKPHDYSELKVLHFNATAKVCFVKKNNKVRPILLLIGLDSVKDNILRIIKKNKSYIGKYEASFINGKSYYSVRSQIEVGTSGLKWLTLDSSFITVYPRICIESLNLKIDDINLSVIIDNQRLENYTDYLINTKTAYSRTRTYLDENNQTQYVLDSNYYITFQISAIIKFFTTELKRDSNLTDFATHTVSLFFTLSNADTAIYYDAIGILKDSSKPKVSYELSMSIFKNDNCIKMPSKYLNHIIGINDYELKFENVKGYISRLTLDLDHPWQDSIEIKNYTTKFEDLFTKILAQTEAMQKTSYLLGYVSGGFDANGQLRDTTVQKALNNFNFDYAFNNGKLTINEENGIWVMSDSGVVAIRGGGIFCATEQDSSGNWKWNTGITPEGINGDLITAGQIDTSKLRIFAGDKIRFQMNEDGLFAYKSFFEDMNTLYDPNFENLSAREEVVNKVNEEGEIDASQYVKFNENGLFLIAKRGAKVLNNEHTDYVIIDDEENPVTGTLENDELKRVSISWDGLTLKNYKNEKVFFANADTGDLTISGEMHALTGWFGDEVDGWRISKDETINEVLYSGGIIYSMNSLAVISAGNSEVGPSLVLFDNTEEHNPIFNFSNGSLTINGTIYATSGNIGPWYISEDSIYLGSSDYGAAQSIYFGKEGLSFGGIFQVGIKNNSFSHFSLSGQDEEGVKDYFLRISNPNLYTYDENEDDFEDYDSEEDSSSDSTDDTITEDSQKDFLFEMKNIIFDQDLIDSILSNQKTNIYQSDIFEDGAPVFPEDASNGSIGIFYSDVIDQSDEVKEFSFINTKLTEKIYKPGYAMSIHDPDYTPTEKRLGQTFFGKKFSTWNVVSNDRYVASENDPWVIVGQNNKKDGTHAMFVKVKANKALSKNKSFTIRFTYRTQQTTDIGGTVNPNRKRDQGIMVEVYPANSSGNPPTKKTTLVASGTYMVPFSSGNINTEQRRARISLTNSQKIKKNSYYYIVFYSSLPYSKIYIDYDSVYSGKYLENLDDSTRGVYIKTKDAWQLLVGSDGVPPYILPSATSDVLGGIKVGDGLQINSGVLTPKVRQNLTIDDDGFLVNSYDLPTASTTVLGGIKVGSDFSIENGVLSLNSSMTTNFITDEEREKLNDLKSITSKTWNFASQEIPANTLERKRVDSTSAPLLKNGYSPLSIIIEYNAAVDKKVQTSACIQDDKLYIYINNTDGSAQSFSGDIIVYYIEN